MNRTHIRARRGAVRSVIAALVLGLLAASGAACGQRGPLYLPEPDPVNGEEAAASSAVEAGAPDEQQAEESGEGEDRT